MVAPAENDRVRAGRTLPWLLGLTLLCEVLAQATDVDMFHGAVPFLLAGALLTAVQARE